MSAAELTAYSAVYQADLIRRRKVSARELTDAHLARIAAVDPAISAFLLVDADGARSRAGAIDRAMARGDEPPGPLAGVPLALKDMLVTENMPTTAGSRILAGWRPPYDGTAVARLRAAGMVLLGKLNLDEFAMGSSTENSAVAPCRNPWNLQRVPGGSSGGSAAAVAACACAGSLGTDTGGSIRQPAAFCGIVGLKPTYGRVSRYGVIAFASSLDQVGPMGRTVADVALLLETIAGHDPRDATSIDAPVPRYRDALTRDVRGLRIGLPREYFADQVHPEVRAALEAAIAVYRELGADIIEVSLPHTRYALPAYYLIAPAEASSNLARYDGVRFGVRADDDHDGGLAGMYEHTRGQGFGPEVKRRIMLGTFALRSGFYDAYYRKAQQVRTLIKGDFDRALTEVDILLSPTAPTPAFAIGAKTANPVDMYLADIFTLGCSLAGLPGMSVPCGFSTDGLPIGMQLIGRALAEETLIGAAAAYERAVEAVDHRGVPARSPTVPTAASEA